MKALDILHDAVREAVKAGITVVSAGRGWLKAPKGRLEAIPGGSANPAPTEGVVRPTDGHGLRLRRGQRWTRIV